jgi:hypothetical protein
LRTIGEAANFPWGNCVTCGVQAPPFVRCHRDGIGHSFLGLIVEARFYNRALGAGEIKPLAKRAREDHSK